MCLPDTYLAETNEQENNYFFPKALLVTRQLPKYLMHITSRTTQHQHPSLIKQRHTPFITLLTNAQEQNTKKQKNMTKGLL